jgi:hypothetical protein
MIPAGSKTSWPENEFGGSGIRYSKKACFSAKNTKI